MIGPVTAESELQELRDAAHALDGANQRLVWLMAEFEGQGQGADWMPGPQLRWLDLVADELDVLVRGYEESEKRFPAIRVLEHRASLAAREKDPELYREYHRLDSAIRNLSKWVAVKSKTISARQSAAKGERELAGLR